MRTQVLSILMSVVALGLIGCGKGFESVNKLNKGLSAQNAAPKTDAAGNPVGVEIPKYDPTKIEQVLRAIDLKPVMADQVQVRAIVQTDVDTILNLSANFKDLVDKERQDSKLEMLVGQNLVNLVAYDSSSDLVRISVECRDNCALVLVNIYPKVTSPAFATIQFQLVTTDDVAIYMISRDGELLKSDFEAKLLEVKAEIAGDQVNTMIEDSEVLQEIEVKTKKRETTLNEYEQAVENGTVDDTDYLKPGTVEAQAADSEEIQEIQVETQLRTMEVRGTAPVATVDERTALDKAKEFGGDLERSHADLAGKIVDGHEVAVDFTSEHIMPAVAPAVEWTNNNETVLKARAWTTDAIEWSVNKVSDTWNNWTADDKD